MRILLKVPENRQKVFLRNARKYKPSSETTRLMFDVPRAGFAYFDIVTNSIADAVKLVLMLPEGSFYAEVEPLAGWRKDAVVA